MIWVKLSKNDNDSPPPNVNAVANTLPGMKMLQDYQCHYAEEKIVIVNGIEDNYSPAGLEPARVHKRMGKYNNLVIPQRNYDDGGLDRNFFDYFELPVNITSGIFVIGLRPLGDNNNDLLFIGDTASNSDGQINQYYQLSTVEIQNNPAWVSQNGTHKIGLDELVIRQLSFGM
ncbi:MAG: hypothetical protein COA91_13205 [Robiginitomaculum sp.]|nr:MAG: hypothetical protein COA91_13935 [Robiginitomaculum sp.]PHS35546.1 MAG: hypothetical protein COA91_13205 [Robiginitomaculum sp.]